MPAGRTTVLYGLTGTGKTTQLGEYIKHVYKTTKKRSLYYASDSGGFDSISHLEELGIMEPRYFDPDMDPWSWIADAVTQPASDVGLVCIDSGTSVAERLLANCRAQAAVNVQVGQQKVYTLKVPQGAGKAPLVIGANNESQYGLIQGYMLDMLQRCTWIARKHGVDFCWTFGEHRAENPNDAAVVGPKLIGKAMTATIPKEVRYTLRLVSEPNTADAAAPPLHVLYAQEKSELNGLGSSFANARFPLGASTPAPVRIEPASIIGFWEVVAQMQEEAKNATALELGL